MNNIVFTFGTPITFHELTGIEHDKNKLLEYAKDHNNFRVIETSGKNYMSIDDNLLETLECTTLKSAIDEKVKWYADEIMGISYDELFQTQCWLNQYPTGSYHHMHSHPNCLISANVWLKTSHDCGNLKFEDPLINFRQIEPNIIKETPYNHRSVTFVPADDHIVIFPSSVHHMVEKNNSSETRMSLAINYWIKGTLGYKEHYNSLTLR